MRLQVTRRPQQISENQPDLTWAPFAFVDAGAIQPVADDSAITTARSAGLGVRGTYADNVSMIAMVGAPLEDIDGQDIPSGPKVYFGLDYNF